MQKQWMNRSALAFSISLVMMSAHTYAADAAAASDVVISDAPAVSSDSTPSMVTPDSGASDALKQKEGDASSKTNLEQVFSRSEKQYSLSKRGSYSGTWDIDYTYYRDTQLDLALADSSSVLNRLRVQDDAQHTLTNSFTLQYGVLDNLTLTGTLPLVAKSDSLKNTSTAGLGDVALGARWEPFPLKEGRLPLILFGSFSSKTGDSPYEVNPVTGLSTGKGYYSVSGGASTRKYVDPVVLFASASAGYGFNVNGLNQARGSRVLTGFEPGITGGFSFGFAYAFNYDVSLTMSYQQSMQTNTKFKFSDGTVSEPGTLTTASMAFSLGMRVNPKTIVNTTVGFGLTPEAPDVSLGVSVPLDFLGFGHEVH
jgi:hypothetical protein